MSCKTVIALRTIEVQTRNSDLRRTCVYLGKSLENKSIDKADVVNRLSEYFLNFEDAVLLKRFIPHLLLALVSAKIPLKSVFSNSNYDQCNDAEKTSHLEYSIVLALTCDHPDVLQYALKYFEINPIPPFEVFIRHEDSYNVAPKKRRLLDCRQKITDYHMVSSCYKLLAKLPNELSSKWDWTTFVANFSCHENDEIRWMVKECMVTLTNMTEAQSKVLIRNLNLTSQNAFQSVFSNIEKITTVVNGSSDDLHLNTSNVVTIDGIMLPVYDERNVHTGNLVPVKSTVNNLRSLALAVASGQAMLLMGPVGSGKTSLVEHLAAITGRKSIAFKKVQLGDQTDSRMLLGSHQCTDVPGEFIWMPGVLTEAVENGHWLLLEDIDCAALDVASTLSSLLERNTLCVPGYRDALPVTPGFQLFVTQRTVVTNYGFQKKMSNSSTLLQKHLTQINVEPLARSELGEVVQTLYPKLTTICSKMIEVFMLFSVGSHDTSLQNTDTNSETNIAVIRGARLISTRDLMKWCSRAVVGFEVSNTESAMKILQDALDIFTCSVASPDHRLELAKRVSTCLGIFDTKCEFYFKHYKPNVSLNFTALEVGRAKVPRIEKGIENIDFDNKQVVFSFTRQSACLLERIACCVTSNEPVLLVGETGTGKTSSVQYLARQTGHKLVVINMNQQSDSADLLGGYKPVDLKYVIRPIKAEFLDLFQRFYNVEKNKKFLNHIETCCETENWNALLALMKQSHSAAVSRLVSDKKDNRMSAWLSLGHKLMKLEQQVKAASRLTFAFIEGSLVKAMQEGYWVLLDEINLASAEILECLAGLLEDKSESIDLLEKGDKVPIKRHPNFTLFACMNPATDVGKKDLPVGLRNRFTEFFIDELIERNDLMLLIGDYLYHMNLSGATLESIYTFYANIKKEAKLNLVDGAGNAPHYSLRTLCRALTAAAKAKCGTVVRSLYEAFCLSFLTQLDRSSHPKVEAMIAKAVIGKKNIKSVLNQLIPEPQIPGQNYLLFEGHWIPQGKLEINIPESYILTPTVRKNLRDIARIISLGRLPVLLQGDTSVGKTSLITYIAKASGNYCVRINNHEHTDLQEYIGSYATDSSGNLVFKEGVLVEAMRKGYWIILDELNLAPSDVLEALNRVLDDNRELFIPETQQVVKADPNFLLFATQNPPGLYGGRKMLSRAFRNRFVELHFDEIPRKELETILHQRCHVPPTYSKKMIEVMAELQVRRRGSAAVQGKDGFITLRDLFRWGQRYKQASKEMLTEDKFYDWDQHIADEGYLILAGKVRQRDERNIIEEVIEKHIKRKVCPENLFSYHQHTSPVTGHILEMLLNNKLEEFSHVVWTFNMRRLAVLIAKAFTFDEPVLLVGETGCGKTTICQILSALNRQQLFSVNCHMHTESSDFLGGLRPVRQYKNDGKLFEWVDGPLIKAMENGHLFLADEISLADDSVLERLNSLLETERQLVISERGMDNGSGIVVITAAQNFHFIGTMNPGGDFGKKELSPALRNRFTEIWCDSVTSRDDLLKVLEKSTSNGIALGNQEDGTSGIGNAILDFSDWLKKLEVANKFPFSIRDLLSWVQFINITVAKGLLDTPEAYVHGACMTFLDCFGTALTGHIDPITLIGLRKSAISFLLKQINSIGDEYRQSLTNVLDAKNLMFTTEADDIKFGIKPFFIKVGQHACVNEEKSFTFSAPTTGSNTLRLLRGMQLNKAILLEGNPGVGKTSLVTALAKSSGHKVVRINLSDQTDITDLIGTDLPSEDGSFTFKEGAFLSALQNGDWILLDELNLAPQPVLEGLNACLDHRGEIFIPELGKTFKVKEQTKLFACQNPLKQGGARRGLPVSFLNRFTQVYVDTLTEEDLTYIVETQYRELPKDMLHRIVKFNCKVASEITEVQSWGHKGGPFEMNLRDIQRWCEALIKDQVDGKKLSPGKFVDMLYVNRMRTAEDKEKMSYTYDKIFCPEYPRSDNHPQFYINKKKIIIGDVSLERNYEKGFKNRQTLQSNSLILRSQVSTLKALAQNIKMNWLSILVGPTATGKSTVIQILADLTGNELNVVPVTSAMDVSDLLGGFEQVDYNRNLENLYDEIETLTIQFVRNIWLSSKNEKRYSNELLSNIHKYKALQKSCTDKGYSNEEIKNFEEKIRFLINHCDKLKESKDYVPTDINNTVQRIRNTLVRLQTKISNTTSLNVGGKFEWIDALLVKTMIKGSWLLLDNVNLTSAAVLDRLNGLLEPNGVLSIPERGELSEIKPHSNFRVFFTMDPKYGEISRAMRNRGVEIFLLRLDEQDMALSETITYVDLVALLSSTGLPNQYHDICIRCHESMTDFVQGFDRPTVSHLIQASRLTWQQLMRGIAIKAALLNSFSDVYIKPRSGVDFASTISTSLAEMKNSMLKALEDELESEDFGEQVNDNDCHTLTVQGLSRNSSYEISKQICYPVKQQTKVFDKPQVFLFNMLTSYIRCPINCVKLLYHIFQKELISEKPVVLLCCQLNDEAFRQLCTKKSKSYLRYLPESSKLSDKDITKCNLELGLLYNEFQKLFMKFFKPVVKFTSIDYSEAVASGTFTDDFAEYPILKNCQKYLKIIDNYIQSAIEQAQSSFDDTTVCQVIQLLNWRERFFKACSMKIFVTSEKKRTPILKEEIVPLLHIHSKWVQKHLFGKLFQLPENTKLQEKFQYDIDNIKIRNNDGNSEDSKLTKKVRKSYGEPKLYEDENEYEVNLIKSQVYSDISIDMDQPIAKQLHKITMIASKVTDLKMALDVNDFDFIEAIENNLEEKIEHAKTDPTTSDAKVLPITLYVIQRVLNILYVELFNIVNRICSDYSKSDIKQDVKDIVKDVVNMSTVIKGFPSALSNLLQIVLKISENDQEISTKRISSVFVKFWNEFYKMLTNSPVVYPEPFLNIDKASKSDDVREIVPSNTVRFSTNLPLMAYYVQNLTMSQQDGGQPQLSYDTVALKDSPEYSLQLDTLVNTIWKNTGTLNVSEALKGKSDALFDMKKYEYLIHSIHSAVVTKVNSKTCEDIFNETIEKLQNYIKDTFYIELIMKSNSIYNELSKIVPDDIVGDKTKMKILTSQLSVLTSLLLIKMMAEISPMDQVEKYRLKVKYIEEDVAMFDALLRAYYVQGVLTGTIIETRNIENSSDVHPEYYKEGSDNRQNLAKVHPHCSILMGLRDQTLQKVQKYASGNTFRPKEISYATFVKDCKHFSKSILSEKTTLVLFANMVKTCDCLYENLNNTYDKDIIQNAQRLVKETSSWLFSAKAFHKKLEKTYSEAFPDLAKPLQASVSQIMYSVTSLNDLVKELVAKIEKGNHLKGMLVDLMEFPITIPNRESKERFLNRFVTSNFMQQLSKNVVGGDEDFSYGEAECLAVLKMNLSELSMHCYAMERVDSAMVKAVLTTLNALFKAWEKQREDIERKMVEDEALYVTKSKCEDEDEEAIAYEEIMEMFPSFSEDFAEFKSPTLEQKKPKTTKDVKPKHLFTSDDITLIYKWHSMFVRNVTYAEWLVSPQVVGNDVISPLIQRFPTFSKLVQNAWHALDSDFEGTVSSSLLILLSRIKEKINGEEPIQKMYFYRYPLVSEVRECLPLLRTVKEATDALLDQWPDFPTLKDIIVIIDRIVGFPITSPMSRFLIGLELLRDKIEEWNKQAHKNNNMIDISLDLGAQIMNWRKLEMINWKDCFNNLYQKKQAETHKYWFYLYSVIQSYLDDSDETATVTKQRVTYVLKEFMEMSNVAEYEVRLDIVYGFHCHLVHLEHTERRDELLSILWNTYNYYNQFVRQVTAFIKEKRTPIEKKLRDFVKIATWDRDLSYWSAKGTIEKAHKMLYKRTKEFEKILKESVTPCLVDITLEVGTEHVGLWDRPKREAPTRGGSNVPTGGAYMIDPQNHLILNRNMKKYLDQAEQVSDLISEGSLLSKVPSLVNKAKTLCKDTMTNAKYPSLVQALDDFVSLVIERNTQLSSLDVDSTAPKDKRISQAKSMVQQKRKALADLFKYLARMGLNYRTGLVITASEEPYDFTIPPVDFDAAIHYLKSRRCDAYLTLLWSGCEQYFQKNIARHRLLSTALLTPHTDLGLQNIERCKGFAAQLLKLTNLQKRSISKYSRHLCDLRNITNNLMNALDLETCEINVVTLKEKITILTECYANVSIRLDQFTVLLRSFPKESLSSECQPEFDIVLSDSPLAKCYMNSKEWRHLYGKIKDIRTIVTKQKTSLIKLSKSMPKKIGKSYAELPMISLSHIDVANDAKSNLDNIKTDLSEILKEYKFVLKSLPVNNTIPQHPILRCIENVTKYLEETKKYLNEIDKHIDVSMASTSANDLVHQVEDTLASMLLIIQSLYKKHLPLNRSIDNMDVLDAIDEIIDGKSEESKEILEDKHLKELLQENLSTDTKMLQMGVLIERMKTILIQYVDVLANNKNIENVRTVVMRMVPILEQTVLLVQYFVTQKVAVHRVSCKMLSVLLKIFSELATKGFCKPSDLDMEDGEGDGGPGKSGGMGLGDGEGQKDVSERIENQDQLDDAQRPGEEKKQEENDCKEEEKGINMTDDFDSHLQDVEPKEMNESDEEDENEDADKQMGDTDNAAEKLDQQIWGLDDEKDPEEQEGKKEKEEKGKGESTGEKEMGAKEQEQGTDDGSEGKDKQKKKDINEMNEPEIDDDHVDPYHGNQPQLPEPEDFDMPEDINMDGDEGGDDKDEGETETENPFEIDVSKANIPEEETQKEEEKDKDEKHGFEVSSDEEGDNNELQDKKESNEQEDPDDAGEGNKDEEKGDQEEPENDTNPDNALDNPEDKAAEPDTNEQEEIDPEQQDDLPKNPENINEEDEVHEKSHEANPQANPSSDDPSVGERAENAEADTGTSDNVDTNEQRTKDEDAAPFEQAQEQVGEDKQSMGRSELDKSERGHRGEKQAARADSARDTRQRSENKPGTTDKERTLGDIQDKKHKQAQMLNVEQEEEGEGGVDTEDREQEADAYQHVKQAKKDDLQAIDAATKEQADQQPMLQKEDEEGEKLKEDEQVPMDIEEEDIQVEKSVEINSEKVKDSSKQDKEKIGNKTEGGDEPTGDTAMEVEGDKVLTDTVPRGRDTTYHTRVSSLESQKRADDISLEQYVSMRGYMDGKGARGGEAAAGAWRSAWRNSGPAARALCERLRLVLEPTGRSRRAGDFRTGRAINMRRVIPYIASHYRKDRIWLRRTKPAKREYKIAIAVDDSSSMADNRSKELAFESLALVSQALNLLESGELAVLSFGEKPSLLHPFTEQFTEHSGSKILEELRFEQTKTRIAQLLDFSTVLFDQQAVRSDAINAKLLVIVSDGRGIFSEGETKVLQAVRRARQQGIFLVYVIIDNPDNKDSIMDIRRPILDSTTNTLTGFVSYLDTFPFPFYLILRDMSALPTVLGDALRQWFELAANTAN